MGLTIKITNFSSWNFDLLGAWPSLTINETLDNSPIKKLLKGEGLTTMKATQNVATSGNRYAIQLEYQGEDGHTFGIGCLQRSQALGLGANPQWQGMTTDGKAWSKWINGSSPHTWRFGKTTITATPTIAHSDISISVVINDISNRDSSAEPIPQLEGSLTLVGRPIVEAKITDKK